MKAMKKIKVVNEFTVKRSDWLRGGPGKSSYLRRISDGKQCCLGFYTKACGFKDEEIEGVRHPMQTRRCRWFGGNALGGLFDELELMNTIARINDSTNPKGFPILEAEREERLARLFAEAGVKVNFVD